MESRVMAVPLLLSSCAFIWAASFAFLLLRAGAWGGADGLRRLLAGRWEGAWGAFGDHPTGEAAERAGAPLAWRAALCASAGFLGVFLLSGRALLSVPPGLAAGGAPILLQRLRRSRRRALFERQLAHAGASLAGALQAGVGLRQGLESLAAESANPLSSEVKRLLSEHKLGKPLSEAIGQWSERWDMESLSFLASAVSIAQQTGGRLAAVLQQASVMIRKKQEIRDRARALSAQGRLSGFVVGSVPFVLLGGLGILAPELIQPLFATQGGNILLLLVCFLVGAGLFVMARMADIDV